MSLTSLVDETIVKREQDVLRKHLKPRVFAVVQTMVPKYGLSPDVMEALSQDLLPLAAEAPTEPTRGSNALDALVRYVPTEAITLYVAALSALPALKATFPVVTEARVYWFFVVLTPILFLVIFGGKRRSAKLPAFPALKVWPWFRLCASTVAFAVWALAVPTTPYLVGEAGKVVAGFGAVFVSTFLTLIEPLLEG